MAKIESELQQRARKPSHLCISSSNSAKMSAVERIHLTHAIKKRSGIARTKKLSALEYQPDDHPQPSQGFKRVAGCLTPSMIPTSQSTVL